jgi:hypothetical protein
MVNSGLLRGSGFITRTIDLISTRGVKYWPAPFFPSLAAFSSKPSNAAPFTSTSIADQFSSSIIVMTRLRLTGLLKRGVACAKISLLNEVVALLEDIAADIDELLCMRRVRQVVNREDQNFRKSTGFLLVLVGIFRNFLDDFAIAVGCGNGMFDRRRIKRAFVLQIIQGFKASLRIDLFDLFAFFQKDAVDSDV